MIWQCAAAALVAFYLLRRWSLGKTASQVAKDLNKQLVGRVVIVTGGNSGVGKEAARVFKACGAHVIVACRKSLKTEVAVRQLQEDSKLGQVTWLELDLGSLASIRQFSEQFLQLNLPLDYLVLNAGLVMPQFSTTVDGFETTVGVNHLGHFYLTSLLQKKLIESAPSRVVVVASQSHKRPGCLDFNNLLLNRDNYNLLSAYASSKLMNVLFARELNKRLSNAGVTAYSLHPGTMILTDMGRSALWLRLLYVLLSPFTKSVEQGAATTVYCALADGLQGGEYYNDCAYERATGQGTDDEVADRLWQWSEKVIQERVPKKQRPHTPIQYTN
eukprot:GILJ01003514.1.p1 GENE.GILJ01003514.1~~GILJ01003514.1.p1  ORF type:complete len:330 (-),score=48.19 GILJ01003514.1:204-1193(-)